MEQSNWSTLGCFARTQFVVELVRLSSLSRARDGRRICPTFCAVHTFNLSVFMIVDINQMHHLAFHMQASCDRNGACLYGMARKPVTCHCGDNSCSAVSLGAIPAILQEIGYQSGTQSGIQKMQDTRRTLTIVTRTCSAMNSVQREHLFQAHCNYQKIF